MLISWNWLREYVSLDVEPGEVERRLMMAGLNHEGTVAVGDDLAIDLEVTSNRPDCLGHLGVAREAAVLFGRELRVPDAEPLESGPAVSELTKVRIDCPELCYRYTARVIRGVKVGPSPAWLADRLRSVGVGVVSNIVDISNYVLMESGQPLHAFDLNQLRGPEILVREASSGETFTAIDHREYTLEPGMCVIADARRSVALGGVMGGADTEVSKDTTDLLIESAEFAPLSIRTTARKLNLHSPSSYRFERRVDPVGIDWASRRCCQLILELAGGELAPGAIDVGQGVDGRKPVALRLSQLERILGISIPEAEVRRILVALGNDELQADPEQIEVIPPSWRRDLTREIDLVEEVARIFGYEEIPEDTAVAIWPSHRSDQERVVGQIRSVLTAAGFDEAMTASVIPTEWSQAFSPWTAADPIVSDTPMKGILADAPKELSQADNIRRSLIPSLMEARRYNESVSNPIIELFEIAKVYLPHKDGLPVELWTIGITSGEDYYTVKGILESVVRTLNPNAVLEIGSADHALLQTDKSAELRLNGERLGFLGEVASDGLRSFGLRSGTTVAELQLDSLEKVAALIPSYSVPSPYPSISRDVNLVVDERLAWSDLASSVRGAAGEWLETLDYQDVYRDVEKDGRGKKRLLFSLKLRSTKRTLTREEADTVRDAIVAACQRQHNAQLLA